MTPSQCRAARPSPVGRIFALSLALAFAAGTSRAQSGTAGTTPSGLAPGSPAGSYALSGFEDVNLFNGNLNFHLPLVTMGGRGSARHTMTLAVDQRWTVEQSVNEISGAYSNVPVPFWWNGIKPGYGPGVLQGRHGGDGSAQCGASPAFYNLFSETLTRLTFTSSDGTEYELRDAQTGGQPQPKGCANEATQYNRGRVFVTADGASATFISDADITDQARYAGEEGPVSSHSGYLLLRDGTRYRIDGGTVTWARDRNGNLLSFAYDANKRVTAITDPLGRQVTVAYDQPEGAPYGTCDRILYKGFGGAERVLRVCKTNLGSALRTTRPSDVTTPQTYKALFPALKGSSFTLYDASVVGAVWLPDDGVNRRAYKLFYNQYGELARVVLPTGGAIEYDHAGGYVGGNPDGAVGTETSRRAHVHRRVVERRVYPDGTSLENRTTYSRPESMSANLYLGSVGHVTVEQFDSAGTRKTFERHYFNGTVHSSFLGRPIQYSSWLDGREYKTEVFDASGTTPLLRTEQEWRQRAPVPWWNSLYGPEPANDPRLVMTIRTVEPNGANLVSKTTSVDPGDPTGQTVAFDQYNNQTDIWEYDYGSGASPAWPVRHLRTRYLTTNNGIDYTDQNGAHIRHLPKSQQTYAVNQQTGAETLAAQSETLYDETSFQPLTYSGAVSGWSDPGTSARGNATTGRVWLNTTGAWLETHARYDQLGNIRVTWDARDTQLLNPSLIDYDDSFSGLPPEGLSAPTYALPTRTASPAPDTAGQYGTNAALVSTTVYDFSTGLVHSATDANNQTTRFEYNDEIDRPTAQVLPSGARTDIEYDPDGHWVRVLADLDATRRTESKQFSDGMGRVVRAQSYENADASKPWLTTDTEYDAFGRVRRVSLPYRWVAGTSAPFSTDRWAETAYDALGRVRTVTTMPDGAAVTTDYSGDRVLVKDQAGKGRISRADALGRLTEVWEVTPAEAGDDASTVAVAFPGHPEVAAGYLTAYKYDVLGNLRLAEQAGRRGGQQVIQRRFFAYDSLGRLVRAKNPEQGNLAADADFPALTDSTSGISNSDWSTGYNYDANGNPLQRRDARGVTATYHYDRLNRNIIVTYAGGGTSTPEVRRYYDFATRGLGRPWKSEAVGTARTVVDEYDEVGRPKTYSQQFWVNNAWGAAYGVGRGYDLAGNVTSQTYPSGHAVNYRYDLAGRLADQNGLPAFDGNLGDGAARTYSSGITYYESGRMSRERFGTQTPLYHKRRYTSRGQLYDIRVSTGADAESWNRGLLLNHYSSAAWTGGWGASGPDNNGNLLRGHHFIPKTNQSSLNDAASYTLFYQDYEYDQLNRLTKVTESNNVEAGPRYAQGYDYDRWGNRTVNAPGTWEGGPSAPPGLNVPEPQFAVSAATNRLGVPAGLAGRMDYDAAGNLTNDSYTSFGSADGTPTRAYDAEGRMTSAQFFSGQAQTATYTYDADGRRVRRDVGASEEVWQVYGIDGELLADYAVGASPAQPRKEYGYRAGELLVTAEPQTIQQPAPQAQRTNVALAANGASATASSTYSASYPTAAVINGDRRGLNWGAGGGWNDATADAYPDWVEVAFAGQKAIDEVSVFTLQDGAGTAEPTESMTFTQYGVTAFDVQYWDGSAWQTVPGGGVSGNNKVWRKLTFPAVTTEKIRVKVDSALFHNSRLVEVEAWGADTAGMINHALGKAATQSSTFDPTVTAARAVDGDIAGTHGGGSISHTNSQPQAWWQVDLGGSVPVSQIRVWNRADCCTQFTSNFYVLVSNTPFASNDLTATLNQAGVSSYHVSGAAGAPTTIAVGRTGHYVRVQLAGTNYLTLSEVEVLGAAAAEMNLALNKAATQSSTFDPTVYAGRAADGNTAGTHAAGTISHTNIEANAWWQVDLGGVYSISNIKVWNRADCCTQFTSNFYVLVSDSPFASTGLQATLNQAGVSSYYVSGAAGMPTAVPVGRAGRYVRVQLAGTNYLTLSEVEVFGAAAPATPGAVRWLVADQLGTPRMVVDETGSLAGVTRHDYLPFGEELGTGVGGRTDAQGYSQPDGLRQGFTGQERDKETGLDYFGARYYMSAYGRFTSPDPLLSSGRVTMPQSWNRYTYTLNNPLRYVDPTGLYEYAAGTTDQQKKKFEAALEKARGQLAAIEKKYGKDSTEYTDAVRALNAYGNPNEDNGVTVSFTALRKGTQGSTLGTMSLTGENTVDVMIDLNQADSGNELLTTIAHEGSHVQDNRDYQGAVLAASSEDAGMAVYNGPLRVTHGASETRAYGVSSVFAEFTLGGGTGESPITSAGGTMTIKFDLPPVRSITVGGKSIWESSWQKLDIATIRANRTAAIAKGLSKDPRYAPKLNTPIQK